MAMSYVLFTYVETGTKNKELKPDRTKTQPLTIYKILYIALANKIFCHNYVQTTPNKISCDNHVQNHPNQPMFTKSLVPNYLQPYLTLCLQNLQLNNVHRLTTTWPALILTSGPPPPAVRRPWQTNVVSFNPKPNLCPHRRKDDIRRPPLPPKHNITSISPQGQLNGGRNKGEDAANTCAAWRG